MKLKVKQGSVKYNDTVYTEGQEFEIDEKQGNSLLNAKIAEEVKEVVREKQKKAKEVEKPKEEVVEEVPVEEVVEVEPSLDWTRNELVEHASSLGIEDANKLNSKKEILKAIKVKEVKSK
jgi:hypothetical protein